MRQVFINTLGEITRKNKNIYLLTGDLGYTIFEKYRSEFPSNFINAGVAEENMVGVAVGLALSGKIPFIYSISPFLTSRAYEQIRNDVCLPKANVKIIGIGAGISYAHAGPSHHALEDIAIMRALPNMVVLSPADPVEVVASVKTMINHCGPVYLRLGKSGEPVVHKKKIKFEIGKGLIISEGKDGYILTCGAIANTVLNVVEKLKRLGYSFGVISMHTVKPLDTVLISQLIDRVRAMCTVEEHNIIGGLGGAVSEFLAESSTKVLFKRFGIEDIFCQQLGNYKYMQDYYGLSENKLTMAILNWLKNGK